MRPRHKRKDDTVMDIQVVFIGAHFRLLTKDGFLWLAFVENNVDLWASRKAENVFYCYETVACPVVSLVRRAGISITERF